MSHNETDLVLLLEYNTEHDAEHDKAQLEEEGIFCLLQKDRHDQLMGGELKVKLLVPSEQLEFAKKLMDEDAARVASEPLQNPYAGKGLKTALLLSFFITFGAGHYYIREYYTGIVLTLLEITGFMFLILGYRDIFVYVLIFAPIVYDALDVGRVLIQSLRPAINPEKA